MKNFLKVAAIAAACMMLFAACQKKETPTNATPDPEPAPPAQTETENKTEEPAKEPEADPKDEIVALAEENKEDILDVMKEVVEVYRGEDVPDYYAAYPDKEEYPNLESTEGLVLVKGDDTCDVQAYVNLGNSQKKLCVSLKHIAEPAEGTNEWMVVATSFGDIKG